MDFNQLLVKYIDKLDAESEKTHPIVKGRYRVGDVSYITCIHQVLRSRERPRFSVSSKKKMLRGKTIHPILEDVYAMTGHKLLSEKDAKRVLSFESSRVESKTFTIVGVPDIVDLTDSMIVEFKTVSSDRFFSLSRPSEHHTAQASMYAYLHGLNRILIIYVNAESLDAMEFYSVMDRGSVIRGIETADVLFYYDTFGELPREIPPFLISQTCKQCMRDLRKGDIICEQQNLSNFM